MGTNSPYRFFPTLKSQDLGLYLHHHDLCVDKLTAFLTRRKARDMYDFVTMVRNNEPIAAYAWAIGTKTVGYQPFFVLNDLRNRL